MVIFLPQLLAYLAALVSHSNRVRLLHLDDSCITWSY